MIADKSCTVGCITERCRVAIYVCVQCACASVNGEPGFS